MAEDEERSSGSDAAAIPLADGGTEHRAAKGAQAGDRAVHDIVAKTAGNAVLSRIFVI